MLIAARARRAAGRLRPRVPAREEALPAEIRSWHVGASRAGEFTAAGYKRRHFFPHEVYWLPKCGPDAAKLAKWMCGIDVPAAMWELDLYADAVVLNEFPADLFEDDDLIWHQQQFGLPGHIGTASVVIDDGQLYSLTHVSDVFQRISRRREHKTRIEKCFKGWNHMLLNAVLHFALEQRVRSARFASSPLAFRHTDRSREVDRTIFDRIYDRTLRSLFPARRRGDWWEVAVEDVRERIVVPDRRRRSPRAESAICVCHDIERGLGHEQADFRFAQEISEPSMESLHSMLQIERELGVRATYNVVGSLMDELRPRIEGAGGSVAFHSFDHDSARGHQLLRCREVDYRIKGYRPPQSRITRELSDRNLLWHNFEWLASSSVSLEAEQPSMRNGIVRLPIHLDDHPLHTGEMCWEEWEHRAIELIRERGFAAICLHDCYGHHWLPRYREFLTRLREHGALLTLDEAAAEVTLRSAG